MNEDAYSQFSEHLSNEKYEEAAKIIKENPELPIHGTEAIELIGNLPVETRQQVLNATGLEAEL